MRDLHAEITRLRLAWAASANAYARENHCLRCGEPRAFDLNRQPAFCQTCKEKTT